MNYLKLFLAGLFIILFSHGCGDSGVTGGVGFIPRITYCTLVNVSNPGKPFAAASFIYGDHVGFDIAAEDNDLDMKTLWLTFYDITLETPIVIEGPTDVALPKQTAAGVSYSATDLFTLTEPAGKYEVDVWIEDARGNKSNLVLIPFTMN
jgi:hypothetical protein